MQQYSPSEITPDIISVHVKSALSRGFLIDSPISRNGNTLVNNSTHLNYLKFYI